ncbi:hypothetical protein OQZ33_07105 [Pedobacter sp. MC2016-05]|uniref:hypothetical protein n=1 Tax=Pedobacter sp. MC2016-05 TaxID=2994474 RepID=UPI0022457A86|nr:hypothetical protein [Pedobacter sp. MC2016-05]MCX2474093.1 hypothetical protein [Pedobacter sp. MC2016-05]
MACESIDPYLRECGKVDAGIRTNYLIAFADLAKIDATGEVYSTSVNGIVSNIALASGKKFVQVDNTSKTGAFKASSTRADNGVITSTQEYTMGIDNFSAKSNTFIDKLLGNPVVILTKMKSGKYGALGLDGTLFLSTAETTVDDATNGTSLTFTGDSSKRPAEVDATIVASLIA